MLNVYFAKESYFASDIFIETLENPCYNRARFHKQLKQNI